MEYISRSEIMREYGTKWLGDLRFDGKEGFREVEKYGNRHAVFEQGAEWGEVHYDQYNATTFPPGTVNHLAKWGHEQTGINERLLRWVGWGALFYGAYRLGKYLDDNY
ncbi:MAG: hypothetical protein ABI342_00125 [Nitrososphaera sp.]|jgi:hypothetical protein